MKNKDQRSLPLDLGVEWEGMPEFVQDADDPFSTIIIRFATEEHLKEFSEMIGQPLTPKTKSIWHPKLVRGLNANKRFVDEED